MLTGAVETIGTVPSALPDPLNVCVVRFTICSSLTFSPSADIIRHPYGSGTLGSILRHVPSLMAHTPAILRR